MNVGQLKETLKGFNDETEIKIGGWTESNAGVYRYRTTTLESEHINTETAQATGKTVIVLDSD